MASLAASVAPAPSAPAAEVVSCTFDGLAGNITPDIAPIPSLGGAGTYDFGGEADNCTYAGATGAVTLTGAEIESTGRYENDICGTGRAFGHGNPRQPGSPGPGTYVDFDVPLLDFFQVDYRIDFFGGHGVLRGGNLVPDGTINNDPTWRLTGVVQIRPSQPGGCVTSAVGAFEVTGHFVASRP